MDPRLRRGRLPDRHDEARQRRVLAEVRARRARLRARPRQARVPHVRRGVRHHEELHVALHDAEPHAGRDRLPVPGRGAGLRGRRQAGRRAEGLLRGRRLVHRRRLERLPAADVPREPRHGPDRLLRRAGQPRRDGRRAGRPRPARARAHVPLARQPGHLLRRRAGLHAASRRRPGRAPDAVREPGPEYLDDDLLGTTATHAQDNFVPGASALPGDRQARRADRRHKALRNGAHQHRYAEPGGTTGIYAFSRIDRRQQREYVVALNNAETAKTAAIPTYAGRRWFKRIYGEGEHVAAHEPRDGADGHRAAALRGGLQARREDPALAPRAVDRPRRARARRGHEQPHGGRPPTSAATRSTR